MVAQHHIVIDAGSSGTRLFLFEVEPGPYPVVTCLNEVEIHLMQNGMREDGINNFVQPDSETRRREVLSLTILPLLDQVRPTLVQRGIPTNEVKVDLFATAGMRYAEKMFGSQVIDDFYDLIKKGIDKAGFHAGQVRTCDGESEEGVWTWINLNDLERNVFRTEHAPLGIVEVGGSSAQLTYVLDGEGRAGVASKLVSINGKSFPVCCKTYLGLGQDDARKAMRMRLAERSNCCFPKGFQADHDLGDVLDGVGHFRLSDHGDFDFKRCLHAYEEIIQEMCASCSLPDLSQLGIQFVATDAVYHATRYWDAENDPVKLVELIMKHCHETGHFPGIETNEFVQAQAANATYVHALLYGRSGLFRSDHRALSHALPNKVNDKTRLTWTRGYLIERYSR